MRFSADQIATCVHGRLVEGAGDTKACALCWDSRHVEQGALYAALPGARVDGNDFVAQAVRAGASVALMTREPDDEEREAARQAHASLVVCQDASRALVDLAREQRGLLRGNVVAVTGSTGKTTTKNLVAAVLATAGPVTATLSNQNNELGVPATILRADPADHAVVVEMGMRGLGQLTAMCDYARPQMALVTNVGTSHIELLGSRQNIARAKAEVFEALPAGGTAFLNAADDWSGWMADHARLAERGVRCVWFDGSGDTPSGRSVDRGVPTSSREGTPLAAWADDVSFDAKGRATFTLCLRGGDKAACSMALPGAHNVANAVAAAAVGAVFGLGARAIAGALSGVEPARGRDLALAGADGETVVDDAYNANPDSMRASLSTFARMQVPGRRVAVLGDMGELGDYAARGHADVGEYASAAHLDRLVCVGPLSRGTARAAVGAGMDPERVSCVDDADAALGLVRSLGLGDKDAVLVKASHATGLDRVVEGLVRR